MHTRQTIGVTQWTLTPVTAYVCSKNEVHERWEVKREQDIIVTNERIFVLNWLKMLFLASKPCLNLALIERKCRHVNYNGQPHHL